MKENLLDVKTARDLLAYDKETGVFTWKTRHGTDRATAIFNKKYAGRVAGCGSRRGYVTIRIRGRGQYAANRLAWLLVTGRWPSDEVDHRNGDPSDNRWSNLRAATRSENGANRGVHSHSKSGIKGVYWRPDKNKWAAQIAFNRKVHKLGYFVTVEDAKRAYDVAATEIHGEFARA